jgi:hypothetical protein
MISYHFEIMRVVISSFLTGVQEGLELRILFGTEPQPGEVLVPFAITSNLKLGLVIFDQWAILGMT